jgi:hypothetical protein
VTAAAAAAAVIVSPAQPPAPGQQTAQSATPTTELSGRQILLQAAEVARAQPESSGAYWHVLQEIPVPGAPQPIQRLHQWTTRDGMQYGMPDGYPGASRVVLDVGFFVGGSRLTLERLERLPTDPDKLTTWMTDTYLPRSTPAQLASLVPGALSRLLWEVPAPPAVRSAALRALANLPNVTNLGTVDGGQALRVVFESMPADKFEDGELPPGTGEMTLVINPDTARLVSFTTYQGTTTILAAEWTDEMPEVISE